VLDGRNARSDVGLRKVSTEMALNVLANNMKRVIAIMGVSAAGGHHQLKPEPSERNC